MFLLYNYEKVAHLNNYGFFWKGLCFNYLIWTLRSYAGSSEGNLFWVDQFDTLKKKIIKGLQDLQILRRRQTKITTFFTKKINSHVVINQLFFYFELFICYSEL